MHRDVVWLIRRHCTDQEVDAFYDGLEKLQREPIENSEATRDPRLSRYMLRFFRFGRNIAVFEYDPGKNRIRVLQCRKLRAKPRQRGAPSG